jgi:hypothetical protein
MYYWFLAGESCCRNVIGGHLLLGFLGSGATNPGAREPERLCS